MLHRLLAACLIMVLSVAGALAQTTVAATTNSSAVIATGNTFQTVLTAITQNNQRRSLTIQNNNTTSTDNCWIKVGGTLGAATKGTSILLTPGAAYTRYTPYIPADDIHATCVTSSNTVYIDIQ